MPSTLDPDGPDRQLAGDADTAAEAQRSAMYGAIGGQIAVGRYILEIGELSGAFIRESGDERVRARPRATPVVLPPRAMRGLLDRHSETAAALSALDAGLPFEATGESGVGKTALLRHLAYHPRAGSFTDGVVYLPARHHASADLLQRLFDAFYETDRVCKPTDVDIRRALANKHALILVDDVALAQDELEHVLDAAPRSVFVVATRERRVWHEGRSLAIKGLPGDAAVLLLERAIERPLDAAERPSAERLCAALEGHPFRILQAAALAREHGFALDGWAREITPEHLVSELVASTGEKQRRVLLALTALPGVPLPAQHISGIGEITDVDAALTELAHRGLVVRSESRYHLAEGVGDRLRRTEDLKPLANRAITYFTAWSERCRRSQDTLLEESEALLHVQQCAADGRRWGEVLRLGRIVEGALVFGGQWGAWATSLEHCLAAAKSLGDRAEEAWALHEIGARAVCLGDVAAARASLTQALNLREALSDDVAAAATRHNLAFVPIHAASGASAVTRFGDLLDFDAPPIQVAVRSARRRSGPNSFVAASITLLLSLVAGWFGYRAVDAALAVRSSNAAIRAVPPASATQPQAALDSGQSDRPRTVTPDVEVEPAAGVPPPRVLIFTARPGSIVTARSAELCYAVSGADQVRIDPDIGEVDATSALNCRRVAPRRTTTYELIAADREGRRDTRQLVLVVR